MDKIIVNLTQFDIDTIFLLKEQVTNLQEENKKLWDDRKFLIAEIQQKENIVMIYEEGMEALLEENKILKGGKNNAVISSSFGEYWSDPKEDIYSLKDGKEIE